MLQTLKQWLWPQTCILCREPTRRSLMICNTCKTDLPWNTNACLQCGLPLTSISTQQQRCGQCLKNPPDFDQTICLFRYEKPINQLITQFKFNKNLIAGRLLSHLLQQRIESMPTGCLPDYIMPVPLHHKRLKERGFNQALELCRPLSKYFNIQLDYRNCIRTRNTQAQSLLPQKNRRKNVRHAFAVRKELKGEHVVIVDDVMTTGLTLQELSLMLKLAGAGKVTLWVCARTSKK